MLKLIATVLSILAKVWGWFRSPERVYERAKNENARIIKQRDEKAINRKLDAGTDRL